MADDLPSSTDNEADNPYSVTQASRIYFLPNLMTAGNLFCGFAACMRCIEASFIVRGASDMAAIIPPEAIAHYRVAVWYIFGAMAFDALDGRLARMGGKESLFGAEFDSLADVVSFGLAPALMVFFLIIRPADGDQTLLSVGGLIGFIYLLCAAIRLARFNVITHPLLHRPGGKSSNKDFVGLPVPAAAGTIAALVLFLLNLMVHDRSLQWLTLGLPPLLLLVAMLMVSMVRYPSGKQIDLRTKTKLTTLVIYVAVGAAVVRFKEYAMLIVCLGYIFFGLIRHWRRHGLIKRAPLV
ncbi:MAG: CDP-diacylglycerol--serine O-phosphatidyltransferase [Rariglobus sp.]|jgi:CDP-diacylglycerol--serine O-phosphatidyltransferase|nr:CDP-diacylglycerol--serine O-phosphatidyltransferase [Rariglobus sp.]